MTRAIDPEPLGEAFAEHSPEVRRFLRGRLKCADTAADITQEAYLRLVATQEASPTIRNIRALIFKVARNLAIDHLRSRARSTAQEAGLVNLFAVSGESPQPPDIVAAQDDIARLEEGIQRFDPRMKRIFEMCRLEGLAQKEVAARLGISVSTVEKQIAMAIELLREHLDRGGR